MNSCLYNSCIDCPPDSRHCVTCGWSPEGDARRRTILDGKKQAKAKDPQQGPTRSKRVAKVDKDGNVVAIYTSENLAAKENGVSRTTVRQRCQGLTPRFDVVDLGGCTFRYIED